MSVFDIGDFRVQQLNNGWQVTWQTGALRNSININLEQLIAAHIEEHLSRIIRLIRLMESGPNDLLDDPLGLAVIQAMPDEYTIPGIHLKSYQIPEWHRQQLVKAYNRFCNTDFLYDLVKSRL